MNIIKKIFFVFVLFASALEARDYIIVQSTTSTANTGLLDLLSEKFLEETGIEIRAVAVGTGTAIANAKKGDGDVLMVHAKQDELKFVEEGYGVERFDLMYNDFVIVGPKNDPANIKDENEIAGVMKKLSSPSFKFISRDDNSGTHKKELSLWKIIGIQSPDHSSYIKTGSGMANTINVAAEMQGYVLTDRGTWISFTNKNDLAILFEGDSALFNPYGIIAVNPKKFPHVEYEKSQEFIDWLLVGTGNDLIKNYKINGQQLFFTYN
jgi:tungstate transport system substrate-binding protein